MREKRTSPVMVASVRGLREWTLEPAGLDARSSASLASSALDIASAQLLRESSRALDSKSANEPHPPDRMPANASESADTAPGTVRLSMGLPSSSNVDNPKVRETLPLGQTNRNVMPTILHLAIWLFNSA